MDFSYVAINSKYQKVTGVITAADGEQGKELLHKMGFSVLEITAGNTAEPTATPATTFWFLVRDSNGQKSSGTIEATDRKNAARRLIFEYKFEVLSLCPVDIPEDVREEEGMKDLPSLLALVQQESGNKEAVRIKTPTEEEAVGTLANRQFMEQKKHILEEVDVVTKKAEEIMEKYKQQISGEEYRSIRNNVDTLMRIKLSNNLPYIQSLAQDVFASIERVLSQYEAAQGQGAAITENKSAPEEEEFADLLTRDIHHQAVRNFSALGSLKAISARLNILAKKNIPGETKDGATASVPSHWQYFLQKSLLTLRILFTRGARQEEYRSALAALEMSVGVSPRKISSPLFPTLFTGVLEELRLFIGWLLAFYTVFFFFSTYAFLKGFVPYFPWLMNLFTGPFLLFCFVFLFLTALDLSLWHNFFRRHPLRFLLSSILIYSLFSIFVINF